MSMLEGVLALAAKGYRVIPARVTKEQDGKESKGPWGTSVHSSWPPNSVSAGGP